MTQRKSITNDSPYEPVLWRCGAGHEGGSNTEDMVPDTCLHGGCSAPVWRYGTGSVAANARLMERRTLAARESDGLIVAHDADGNLLVEGDTVEVLARGEFLGHTGRISRLVGPQHTPSVVFYVPWLAVNATSTRKTEGD